MRSTTTAVGRQGEDAAVRHLERLGFRVVARNVQTARGEIDVVAWHQETLVFVEVKSRATRDFGGARAAVDDVKQGRLWRAAEAYLAADPDLWASPPECRFDVVSVAVDPTQSVAEWRCELHEDAFSRSKQR